MRDLEHSAPARRSWIHLSFQSSAGHSAKYRSDIDGLRAIAVLSVLFYHVGLHWCRGGFVGVDVFYVISGYLITSLLAADLERGKFSLLSFYERRMRRIFPALFTVLFFCAAASLVLLNPAEMVGFGKSLLSATLFVSNFYFWHSARPAGYFDTEIVRPLLHTWSLSVEEQFYLLFPLTLFVLYRWARRFIPAFLLCLIAVSFAMNVWTTEHKPVIAFYWFAPRAWELMIGAILAFKALPALPCRVVRESAGWLGLGLILIASCFPSIARMPFPGYVVLLPCLGTGLVIYAGQTGPSFVKALLSFRPLVFIGVISYSLYLWHWPILVFSKHLPFRFSEGSEIALVLISSTAAAFLSFEYIERPFRGSNSPISRRQIFAFGFAASVVTAAFAVAAYRSKGLPERFDASTQQLIASNLARQDDYVGTCSNWRNRIQTVSDIKWCNLGSQQSHKIMFWGDSHVEQLYPAIERLYSEKAFGDRGALFVIASGCLPDPYVNTNGELFYCDTLSRFALMRAQESDVDTVFIGFSSFQLLQDNRVCLVKNGKCTISFSRDALRSRFLSDLSGEIRTLKTRGKDVIVCLPFPMYDVKIPTLEISNAMLGRFGWSQNPIDISPASLRDAVRAVAIQEGARVFDPRETLCPNGQCLFEKDGVSIYIDESHIAQSQADIFAGNLRQALMTHKNAGAE